jgi:predicted RNA-binding protein with EMAP domain
MRKGSRRPTGKVTPKRMHSFCVRRINEIKLLLQEIAYVYTDVDEAVNTEATRIMDQELGALREALDYSLEEGRSYD